MDEESEYRAEYASPPCYAHELARVEDSFALPDAAARPDVGGWRKLVRQRLVAQRRSIGPLERRRLSAEIGAEIRQWIEPVPGLVIALYWPCRNEPFLIDLLPLWHARGARMVLPVVRERNGPLIFREWTPDCRMVQGAWNIPVPVRGAELSPDVVIAPVVGFDASCYRLGNGGGYYDRTLAGLAISPFLIGVGYPAARLATIFPQPQDVPMHIVITGRGQVPDRSATWPRRLARAAASVTGPGAIEHESR